MDVATLVLHNGTSTSHNYTETVDDGDLKQNTTTILSTNNDTITAIQMLLIMMSGPVYFNTTEKVISVFGLMIFLSLGLTG